MVLAAAVPAGSEVSVRIKDISFINGLKMNQVYGFGLVVGLQGSGDTRRSPLTKSTLQNMLKNLGMEGDEITSKNSAAVMVTASLEPFVRVGDRVDVTVSSIGDARSLEGGILIQSPLRGADNQVYVVAQGPLSIQASPETRRNIRTVAVISNGGIVEREIEPQIVDNDRIFIVLKNWDYSLANDIIKAVEKKYPASQPAMTGSGKIRINVDTGVSLPEFISTIENLEVTPRYRARVVINERDGTIVTGGEVKLSAAMVSREGLTVEIQETARKVSASELGDSSTVKDLVDALNAIGAKTSDIIAIMKALKESGALHGELIVR